MNKLKPKDFAELLLELTENKDEAETKKEMKGFVALLSKKKMLSKSEEIITEYRKLYNKKHGIVEATVTLVERMTMEKKLKLREALKKQHKAKEVHMLEKVDARLLGGMKVRIGDMVYDASLKNTLNQLEAKLTA
jgi:F-type H+-transporting ATPase subunit delta